MSATTFTIKQEALKIVMERTFDAPRDLVFKAFTDADAIPKWWGKRAHTTTVDKMDVRPGGAWRFVSRDEGGEEYGFHGVFKEVNPPRRLSLTFNFEGIPGGHEVLEVTEFEDLGGKTKVTTTASYANLEDLEGMVASGMEGGAVETWDRLAELLADETFAVNPGGKARKGLSPG